MSGATRSGSMPQIINRGNDRVDLVYVITEGAKTPVRQIDFVGNKVFGKRQLSAVIKTSATHMLSFPDRRRRLRSRPYRAGPGATAALLPQQGLCRRQRDFGQGRVRSRYEGIYADASQSTRARSITSATVGVACNVPGLDCEKLRRRSCRPPGAVFDGNALDKTTELLAIEMAKLGYPFAQADSSHHPRCRRATHRRRLRHRSGAANLCRTHRNPRQHPHPRLCDPARIRHCRRRCLQQDADRSGRAAPRRI